MLGYTTPLWVAIGAAMFLSERDHAPPRDRDRLRPGGPCGHLQSADAELGRPQRAVRQRADSGRGVLLGRQHRLCPGAQMDLDAVSTGVLAGAAGGRAALGHRVVRGRPPHIVWTGRLSALLLFSGIVCTAFANWAMTMVNRSLPAVTTSLWLLATPLLGIFSATAIWASRSNLAVSGDDADHRRHRARHRRGRFAAREATCGRKRSRTRRCWPG